jgi:hypothetical protein
MGDSTGAAWLSFSRDMNADGEFTFTDIWLWTVHFFFIPGDAVVWVTLTYVPWLARFLELGAGSYGELFSAIVSAAIWLFGLVMTGALYSLVLDLDRALTGSAVRFCREWLRRARVLRTWLACQVHGSRQLMSPRRRASVPEIDLDELDLEEIEIEVLRSHAFLAPGYLLNVSELASSLEIHRAQAQKLLDKLEGLALLQRGFGSTDGQSGYRLSPPGQFVLMARSRIGRG